MYQEASLSNMRWNILWSVLGLAYLALQLTSESWDAWDIFLVFVWGTNVGMALHEIFTGE